QRLGEQVGEVQHLDAVIAQRLGEAVVLVLRAPDPRDAVEEQIRVVAWGEPLELGSRSVQQDGPQPTDLAVGAVGVLHGASVVRRAALRRVGGHPGRIFCPGGPRQRQGARHTVLHMSSIRNTDESVLEAARACVLAVGVRRTTLTDVARRAGLSRMTLYRRYPDVNA